MEYCTLVSSDNHKFTISHDAAKISGTLASLLGSGFSEATTGIIRLESIEGVILEKVVEYLYYHLRYRDEKEIPDFEFGAEFALNLLVAADFLDGASGRLFYSNCTDVDSMRLHFCTEF